MQELTNDNYSEIKLCSIFRIEYKAIEFSTNKKEQTITFPTPILEGQVTYIICDGVLGFVRADPTKIIGHNNNTAPVRGSINSVHKPSAVSDWLNPNPSGSDDVSLWLHWEFSLECKFQGNH